MKKIALHLSRATWIALVFGLVLLAIIVSAGRVVMPMVSGLKGQITDSLGSTLETRVYLGELTGRLHNFNPAISLDQVVIYQPEQPDQPSVSLENIILELDTISTLVNLEPVFRRVMVGGGELNLTGEPGHIGLAGFPRIEAEDEEDTTVSQREGVRNMLEVLSRQRQIDFENIHLSLSMNSGKTHDVLVDRLTLTGPSDGRKMSARISSASGEEIELAMNVSGHAIRWPDIMLDGYISTPTINFKKWLELLPESLRKEAKLKFNQLRAGTQAWFSYSPRGWKIHGNLTADMVDIDREGQTLPPLTSLRSDFALTFGKHQDQQLWLNNLSFIFSGYAYPGSNVFIRRGIKPDRDITIAADRIHLQALSLISTTSNLLPNVVNGIVTRLAPRGRINNFVLKLKPSSDPFDLDLSAELRDVGVDHWYGAPSGERINAKVRMNAREGVIDLDSRGFTLGLDNVFDDVWVYDRVAGKLYWHIIDDVYILRTDQMSFTGGEGDIEARLRLDIPFGEDPIWMALEAGITSGDALYAGKYLPTSLGDLNVWLNSAIKGGDISQGAFIWNGPLTNPVAPKSLSWGLFFDVSNTDFAYDPEWPEVKGVDGLVTVDQDEVVVKADKARVYDSRATGLTAIVPDLLTDKPLTLKLTGQVTSNGRDGLRILRETPIATAMNNAADQWDIGGDVRVGLDLNIPLTAEGRNKEDIKVDIGLAGNRFAIPDLDLAATNISGRMSYSTAKGLQGTGLSGSLFDKPVTFGISTSSGRSAKTQVDINGRVAMKPLSQWLGWDYLWLADGETDYKARVTVGGKGDIRVDVDSSLVGMTSSMPEPLDKKASQKLPYSMSVLAPAKGPFTVEGSLAGRFDYVQELDRKSQKLSRGGARIGQGKVELPDNGFLVTGQLDALQLKPWHLWWQKNAGNFRSESGETSGSAIESSVKDLSISVKDVSIDRLLWGGAGFNNVQASFSQDSEGMHLGLKAPEGDGVLTIPADNRPLRIDMAQLNLPGEVLPEHKLETSKVETNNKQEEFVDPFTDVVPADIPDLDVHVERIRIGEQEFGHLSTKIRTVKDGIKTTELKGVLGGAEVDGNLGWTRHDGQHHTVINASIDSTNVEEFLAKWGYPELMTGKRLKSSSYWTWVGSPGGFQMKEMEGHSDIEVRNGRFLSVDSSSSSALRLFGVLNVDAITRRLRLDFSDLFRSGMAFDQVEGKLSFDKGQINLKEPLTVKGPSSDFKLDGSLNVVKNTLDMGLVVTLPVTQNIAVVSLLLGQPYIAGAAYLFDKLLGSQVEQFASLRYEIKGSLSEPAMKLDRLFSNKAKHNKKKFK
ncbi:TIGR02099 family protein [Sansalvadorimonas sp. 2012CJ34-2]|uniref:TIGR02099 family protein n=1 Tax=Parendozoicomonas callyspongiae TaxID=2942213 RepID=A0ABT0PC30_9GAMM|nr:YhdP family protein [Sansalvadorimonas sp. 2012CJ34-2]MCL6268904.1 TIGR02099 family protein [Sansalvadorimonas sp. 2012CJ34-2]